MSGDLARPAVSIPRGVLAAVFVSMIVYFGCAVLLAGGLTGEVLRDDYLSMKRLAILPGLIDLGVFAATLSSALASFLGAPRILQSLANDNVFPILKPFAASGEDGNPRRAAVLTLLIALAVVALGDLNTIAAVVSMFFLISYGLLNYATYREADTDSPSFRPTFRFYRPWVGLAGALACAGAMLAIDATAAAIAVGLLFAIYSYLERRAGQVRFADSQRSYHLHEAREHLLAAAAEDEHPRDWRPQLLVLSNSAERRARLLRFTSWIEGNTGLTTLAHMLEGAGEKILAQREQTLKKLAAEIQAGGFTAFPLVVAGNNLDQLIATLAQTVGTGPLRINTLVSNWVEDHDSMLVPLEARASRNLNTAFRLGCNLLILDADGDEWRTLEGIEPKKRVIDIWWHAGKTGELMLLLAHLVQRADTWRGATLRLLTEPQNGERTEQTHKRVEKTLEEFRIDAEAIVCAFEPEEVMRQSQSSALVFLPFSIHGGRFYGLAGGDIRELIKGLGIVVLTLASQDVDLDADPDDATSAAKDS
jgi:hypothetical protein